MCSQKVSRKRAWATTWGIALLGMALPIWNAQAANCLPGVGAAIGVDTPYGNATIPHNGQDILIAHCNDVLTISGVSVFNAPNTCALINGQGYVVLPDNSPHQAMQNFTLSAGTQFG